MLVRNTTYLSAVLILGGALSSARASAHISLEQGGTHLSRYGDQELKDAPCGRAGGTRGTNIYTYKPGETITVTINEYIPHPSYFRIAFDQDGDDDFEDPVSIKPIDPTRACPFNQYDQCGTTDASNDFYNTPAVLPDMDNLNPHVTAPFGQPYTWQVQLPNVTCDNCTLQVIQVMQDTIHGAYNTDPTAEPSGYIADVYHQCIDLVLSGPVQATPDDGGSMSPTSTGGSSGSGASKDSGCSCSIATQQGGDVARVGLIGLLVALCWRRRRG